MFRNVIMIMIILILLNLSLKENLGNSDFTGGHVGSCLKRFECKEVCNDIYEDNQDRRKCKKLCEDKNQCR